MAYDNEIFVQFAGLLCYPEIGVVERADSLRQKLLAQQDDVAEFCSFVQETEHSDVEELFTRTFDMNPARCLEIGWHLFGEDYRRGEFLVQMRQALEEEDLPESAELPDHLSHCLLLLSCLEAEDAPEFAKRFLLPAIEKILAGFQEPNPYRVLIEVLRAVLRKRYNIVDTSHPALKVLHNQQGQRTNNQAHDTRTV